MIRCNRRDFLKKSAATSCAAGLAQMMPAAVQAYTPSPKPQVVKQVATTCEMCKGHCPVVATVFKDNSIRLSGNVNNPIHGPSLCSRGLAATQLLTHPDRLKYPMKRVGRRGQGKWRQISWDAALQEIGGQIKQVYGDRGGDGLALFSGGRSAYHVREFFRNLGCNAITDSSYAKSEFIRSLGYGTTFGAVPDPALVDLEKSQCIVLIGTHIGENVLVAQVREFCQALTRPDVELVVVDPRFSSAAAKAHHHLPVKPGTDTALILGWINYLIENNLYNQSFVAGSCTGFAELREHVAPYTLKKTAEITDLSQEQIAGIAERMAQAGPATTIIPGNHLAWYGNDVSRVRALAVLSALLGAVPQPEGLPFDFKATMKPVDSGKILNRIRTRQIGVVGVWGQNMVQSQAPGYFVTTALKEAEFIFCSDIFPSETSLYADIILPEASFLERNDFCKEWVTKERRVIAGSFQVTNPVFSCRSPFTIVQGIAKASGLADRFTPGSEQSLHELRAANQKTSLNSLAHAGGVVVQRKLLANNVNESAVMGGGDESLPLPTEGSDPFSLAPSPVFKTPSGKVELASSWLAHNGYSSLPVYEPPMVAPDGYIRLISGRCPVHTLSRTSGNPWLNHEQAENVLWLSAGSAAMQHVKHGQRVRLESGDGIQSSNSVEVKVTPGIRDDCCFTSHGFGNLSPRMSEGYNNGISVNRLLSRSKQDPLSGVRGLRDVFVRLVQV